MADELRSHPPARARGLAELRLDALEARAEELAQRWAIALILARPLEGIGGVPLEEIAREGASLCVQLLRALQSDSELDRLIGAGAPSGREQSAPARRLGTIAGAQDAVGTIEAAEALRGVLWETLLEQLGRLTSGGPAARQLADLSDRLAYVCARAAAIAAAEMPAPPAGGSAVAAAGEHRAHDADAQPAAAARIVIVDERVEDAPVRNAAEDRAAHGAAEYAPAGERTSDDREALAISPAAIAERPLSWDESPPVPPAQPAPSASPGVRGAEIEIRDVRGEEGPAAWIGSIGRQLERYQLDGVPFAVLLVEPVEVERLRRSVAPGELEHALERLEQALAEAVSGSLTRQRPGRYWLLAPATDQLGARELAERLRQDISAAMTHGERPLELAVGTAVCPDDGSQASALAAHADVGLYASRSAARSSSAARRPTPVDERR